MDFFGSCLYRFQRNGQIVYSLLFLMYLFNLSKSITILRRKSIILIQDCDSRMYTCQRQAVGFAVMIGEVTSSDELGENVIVKGNLFIVA